MRRRVAVIALLLVAAAAIGALTGPAALAAADESSGCSARFPATEWIEVASVGPVTLWTADVADAVALRHRDEIAAIRTMIETDLGPLDPIDVCIFGGEVRLDATGLLPENQRLHAVVFPEDATVVVGSAVPRFIEEAVAFGLAYAALWQVADELGVVGYPEPLATTISQWYMARAKDRLEQHRSAMRTGLFFSDPEGKAGARDWTNEGQSNVYVWNPQFLESPIGDIVEYAVATRGAGVMEDLSSETWSDIEAEYRVALRQELFGDGSGSTWAWGAGIIIGSLALAGFVAWLARREKLKKRGR